MEGAYRPWEVQAGTRNYLKLNWPHTSHNNSRKIPRCIFSIIISKFYFIFNFFITPLNFIFITYYYLAKNDPIFKVNFIYIYILWFCFVFLILYFWESNLYCRFLIFAFWYLLSIFYLEESNFQYPFLLRGVIIGLIALPPFDSTFSSPGHPYLLPPPSLLYLTLWISLGVLGCRKHLGNWLLARLVSLLWLPLFSSWSPLSPSSLFSSLCNSVNLSGCSRLW